MTSISVIGLVSFALFAFQCPEQLVECQDPPADGAKLGKVTTNFLNGDYDEELNKLKGSRYYYPPENNPYFKAADAPSPDADPDADPGSDSAGPKDPAKAGPGDPSPEDDDAAGGPDAGKGKGAEDSDGADDPKGASDPDADADDAGGGADKGGKPPADDDTSGKDQDLKGRDPEDGGEEEGGGKSDDEEDPDGKGAKGDEEGEGSGEEEGSPEEEGEDEKDPDVPLVVPPKIPRHKPKRVNVPLRLFLMNVQRYGYKAAKYPYASPWPNMYGKYGRTRAKKRGGRRRSRQRARGYGYGYGYGGK
ncbi:unnamed protein product [Bemisia tabaci]|uniref:Uncharacterized protein n=1 Tax=Bemisia tabaci TaxID=7038 RepID=A0A9N9ZX59_BEMTA|nr:unnamed protein product [Bemisia tabaci]